MSAEQQPQQDVPEGEEQSEEEVQYRPRIAHQGPLFPRWLSTLIYAVFLPFCVFGCLYIGRAVYLQHSFMAAMRMLTGPWAESLVDEEVRQAPPMDSKTVQEAVDYLRQRGRTSLLYGIQVLLQDEIRDPRMARAIVLRKAIEWGEESRRRALLRELLENMTPEGAMKELDYRLPEQHHETLVRLLEDRGWQELRITDVLEWLSNPRRTPPKGNERELIQALKEEYQDPEFAATLRAEEVEERLRLCKEILAHMKPNGEMEQGHIFPTEHMRVLDQLVKKRRTRAARDYEETKMTEVVGWIYLGRPTPPAGPERRRIRALMTQYEKRYFTGREDNSLALLMQQWQQSPDSLRRTTAEKFSLMLEQQHAELTPEEKELCRERAEFWEALYMKGRVRLTSICSELTRAITEEGVFLDHPQMWDLVRLLHERHEPARRELMECVYLMRKRKYSLRFLSDFTRKDHINPVMAVETARLTKTEHEKLLRQQNSRRRHACIDLARRIALDYCRQPFSIREIESEKQEEFFQDHIIETLQAVADDPDVGIHAEEALNSIRELCSQYMD